MCQRHFNISRLYERIFARTLAGGDPYQDRIYGAHKKKLFSGLTGDVLEVGAGTGVNIPFLPTGVRWTGIEPNPYMHRYIYEKAAFFGREIDVRAEKIETIVLPDQSLDAVICTLVLCSVENPEAALQTVLRALKPGGRFLFIEHVAASCGTVLRNVQRSVRPVWSLLAGGCHPDRETGRMIEEAGFSSIDMERFDAAVPFTVSLIKPHIIGIGVK